MIRWLTGGMVVMLVAGCGEPLTPLAPTGAGLPEMRMPAAASQAAAAPAVPPEVACFAASRRALQSLGGYQATVRGYLRHESRAIGLTLDLGGQPDGSIRATVLESNVQHGPGAQFEYRGGETAQLRPRGSSSALTIRLGDPAWKPWAPVLKLVAWSAMLDRYEPLGASFRDLGLREVGGRSARCLERRFAGVTELVGFDPVTAAPAVVQVSDAAGVVSQLSYEGVKASRW